MEIISHKGNVCYLVWKIFILAPCCRGCWLKSNWDLGGKATCGGANIEDGGLIHHGTTSREMGMKSARDWTGC